MPDIAPVALTGDKRATLEALRQTLAEAIDGGVYCEECHRGTPHPRDLAALSRQLTLVLAELGSEVTPEKGSAVDQLASARAVRRAKAAGSKPA